MGVRVGLCGVSGGRGPSSPFAVATPKMFVCLSLSPQWLWNATIVHPGQPDSSLTHLYEETLTECTSLLFTRVLACGWRASKSLMTLPMVTSKCVNSM